MERLGATGSSQFVYKSRRIIPYLSSRCIGPVSHPPSRALGFLDGASFLFVFIFVSIFTSVLSVFNEKISFQSSSIRFILHFSLHSIFLHRYRFNLHFRSSSIPSVFVSVFKRRPGATTCNVVISWFSVRRLRFSVMVSRRLAARHPSPLHPLQRGD